MSLLLPHDIHAVEMNGCDMAHVAVFGSVWSQLRSVMTEQPYVVVDRLTTTNALALTTYTTENAEEKSTRA